MKKNFTALFVFILLFFTIKSLSQTNTTTSSQRSEFWQKVQYGGGIILNFGSGFTDLGISPTAIYNVNGYFSIGTGLQASYQSADNVYKSTILGGSVLALANPIETIQLSFELEQLNVNRTFENGSFAKRNFWNTGLWLGGGYNLGNVCIGARYNILHSSANGIYNSAFMPFARVFF